MLYTNPTMAPANTQPPCTAASMSELESSSLSSGVSSCTSALMVGQNIQKPMEIRMVMPYNCQVRT